MEQYTVVYFELISTPNGYVHAPRIEHLFLADWETVDQTIETLRIDDVVCVIKGIVEPVFTNPEPI